MAVCIAGVVVQVWKQVGNLLLSKGMGKESDPGVTQPHHHCSFVPITTHSCSSLFVCLSPFVPTCLCLFSCACPYYLVALVWLLLALVGAHSAFIHICLGLVRPGWACLGLFVLIYALMGFFLGSPASCLCLYQIYG